MWLICRLVCACVRLRILSNVGLDRVVAPCQCREHACKCCDVLVFECGVPCVFHVFGCSHALLFWLVCVCVLADYFVVWGTTLRDQCVTVACFIKPNVACVC